MHPHSPSDKQPTGKLQCVENVNKPAEIREQWRADLFFLSHDTSTLQLWMIVCGNISWPISLSSLNKTKTDIPGMLTWCSELLFIALLSFVLHIFNMSGCCSDDSKNSCIPLSALLYCVPVYVVACINSYQMYKRKKNTNMRKSEQLAANFKGDKSVFSGLTSVLNSTRKSNISQPNATSWTINAASLREYQLRSLNKLLFIPPT